MDPAQPGPSIRDRRPDALGDFRVIPDELLCAILECLTPRDVGRLSCVSSVMYILCNEEPLWMRLCLRERGLIEYKGSWKRTTLYRQNQVSELADDYRKHLHFDGFNSLFLYRRWYRCFTRLDAFSVDNGNIERRKDLSEQEFQSEYDGQKPVLLTDLAESWPARTTWTTEKLLMNCGDIAFRISQMYSGKITMKLKDYVSYMQLQHDEDPLYIFDEKFGEVAPTLLKDYSVPHLFREDFFDVLDRDKRPPFRWLIIGPERSGASWHIDPALTSAWNTLLSGRKRWALYPPGRVPAGVTVHVNEEDGDVNIDSPSSLQWWLDVYPLLADHDKPLECTQLPGETIFVPSGWWHCVLNLETTIAVTQNFVNETNFKFVCLDMAPGHRHKGVVRAGLLAVRGCTPSDVMNDASLDTDQLNFPDTTRKEKRLRIQLKEDAQMDISGNNKNEFLEDQDFSYDIDFLSNFLEQDRDHYNSIWCSSNCIGQRELRLWLHKLWVVKPEMRSLIWKGACLALNAKRWLECVMEICASHNLPCPVDDERLPVGTGSNPVYLISGYVIKIYVEGGLESSVHSLGSELEFYTLLKEKSSPLIDNIPGVMASGFVVHENSSIRTVPWDGKGVPHEISKFDWVNENLAIDGFHFGVWSKQQFEFREMGISACTGIWPYLITKRCKGDIFANLRDELPKEDILNLSSFLGDKVRNLHLFPLPPMESLISPDDEGKVHQNRRLNGQDEGLPHANASIMAVPECLTVPFEWRLFIASMSRRKRDLLSRLAKWGDPIPGNLINKLEEYVPHDLAMLLDVFKDKDGQYKFHGSPTWIHTDIMDDNIHMEPCVPYKSLGEITPEATMMMVNGALNGCSQVKRPLKWHPTHILDFSNLSIGDPVCDLIPIYLDVFGGDSSLLMQFLESYRLPLTGLQGDVSSNGQMDGEKKFRRLSYRAMCYCILHEDNILGAIFSIWKELRTAKSWEEVEETVWGELNKYQCIN
ncbi:F-box protein [Acorus calamus]|uniref:F-box protein n=1 Tax=Acorus calamus TaxID=4465 RepID=A0AAV9CGB5_ACOCL|nr:F-box protein [Acorus calamus]